jgi:hypothetical protein
LHLNDNNSPMKSDIINIYRAIDAKNQKGFKDYLHCFYGNQKKILSIFEDIETAVSQKPEAGEAALNDFRIKYTSADPKVTKAFLNDMSELKKWLLEFLALQEIRSGNIEGKFLSLEALRKQGLYEAVQQTSKQIKRGLEENKSPELWNLFWKMKLNHINYFELPIDRLHNYQVEIEELMNDLDNFFIATKLKYSAESFSRSNIRQELYDISFLESVFEFLKSSKKIDPIIEALYLPMLELCKDQLSSSSSKLKNFLLNESDYNATERAAVLFYLLNYTTARLRKGDQSMIEESFELYQIGIDQSLFQVNGYFQDTTFINIVNTACQLKELKWAKQFVITFIGSVKPSDSEDDNPSDSENVIRPKKTQTHLMADARIAFEEKKYDDVLDFINGVHYKNFNFKLNIWTLKLRAAYELKIDKDKEKLLMECNHFYKFVTSNKEIGTSFKSSILTFVKLYRQLVNGKSKSNLVKQLSSIPPSTLCYDWIKMKIEKLSSSGR